MIVVKLIGGLGNQLFQYAIAKKIALQHGTNVVLDISAFEEHYKLHKYSLQYCNFEKRFASKSDLLFFGIIKSKTLLGIYNVIRTKVKKPVTIKEAQFNFDAEVFLRATENTYLDGFWQTEKYFSDIRPILLEELSITKQLEKLNLEFANRISSSNAISLHIRRADYTNNKETLSIHGSCTLEYYANAIKYISEKISNPVLFIFSDDMNWVKENLITSIETNYVDHNNADTNFEDLRLMSFCKHNIIANSSFSWWGAWLNSNPEKIVIAPKRWFNVDDYNTSDLYPSNFIKM